MVLHFLIRNGSLRDVSTKCITISYKWLRVVPKNGVPRKLVVRRGYSSLPDGPYKKYSTLVENGSLRKDEEQERVATLLNGLYTSLKESPPTSGGFISKLFSTKPKIDTPKGLYLHGSVGCGKTMLMDMFYDSVSSVKKKRVHFNEFMLDVHKRIHKFKLSLPPIDYVDRHTKPMDPIVPVADTISDEVEVLCFDEFQVTDVADAMIVKRLFGRMFENGVTMIATSNRKPEDLYKNGLQRVNFIPFISILKENCDVIHLSSNIDYRRLDLSDIKQCYFSTSHPNTPYKMKEIYKMLCEQEMQAGHTEGERIIKILGRDLKLTRTCGKVAFSTFDKLCMEALGPIDYLTIADEFHTVIVENIPLLSVTRKVETRRFITMIDNFYDKKIRLICSAEKPIEDLFVVGDVNLNTDSNRLLMDDLGISSKDASIFTAEEEIFAFDRTKSRLSEMQTSQYWSSGEEDICI